MGAYQGLLDFFGKPLFKVAEEYKYPESSVEILKDFNWFKTRYFDVYKNLETCAMNADNRSLEEYAKDLVASWLIEDCLLKILNPKEGKIWTERAGGDKNREILPTTKVKADSDFLVHFKDGKTRHLELMNNYTDFWKNTGKLHLRENKYNSLKSEKSLFLALSMPDKAFKIYDFSKTCAENDAVRLSDHPVWHKPAYEMNISFETMTKFSPKNLCEAILSAG